MLCCQYPAAVAGCESAFTIDTSRVTFGRGSLAEVGARAEALGMRRVMLFTDPRVATLPYFETALRTLTTSGLDVVHFTEVGIEPTSRSFLEAARIAAEVRPDGYVSLGGGSVIDTCKAANLLVSHPGALHDYVNAPVGRGRPVPGPLAPHIACPTTSGTGSEVTGIAIFDDTELGAKTGIASPHLRPTEALVDPDATATLPAAVVAASGFDVLCHALESFTARPFNRRTAPERPTLRPMSQGANPWSDIGCREALALCGRYLVRAVRDAADAEAREAMMWAATLAGVAFGNAGVHVPHAMAYAIAGMAHETGYRPPGYDADHAMVPHGISVVLGAPAVFRFTAPTSPERHREAAAQLGVTASHGAEVGDALAERLLELMRAADIPNGIGGVGYGEAHVERLVGGTLPQARLLSNAPCATGADEVRALFQSAMRYW